MAFTSVEVTVEDIRAKLKIPHGYVLEVLRRLFGLPLMGPLPDVYGFFALEDPAILHRQLYNGVNILQIGLFKNEPYTTKEQIVDYIVQEAPNVLDLSPWVNKATAPATT